MRLRESPCKNLCSIERYDRKNSIQQRARFDEVPLLRRTSHHNPEELRKTFMIYSNHKPWILSTPSHAQVRCLFVRHRLTESLYSKVQCPLSEQTPDCTSYAQTNHHPPVMHPTLPRQAALRFSRACA